MPNKKCFICNKEESVYSIKDSSESYCPECAEEHFGDVSCLTKIEGEKPIEKKLAPDEEEHL